ncbi:MAG: CPBP family intramembrane metalloprotease [Armatimonadetes bacterium]|nr:CPBP family intramembrane metalloprotease [Armatimonadota bacterium]
MATRREILFRVALIAAALACAVGLLIGVYAPRGEALAQPGWAGLGTTLPADLLYRVSVALRETGWGRPANTAAWWARQLALVHYEWLAYSASPTAAIARVKLALIYGQDGYREQAASMLSEVPRQAPEAVRATLLLDWLYGTGSKPHDLTAALQDLETALEPWLVLQCRADLARRQGQDKEVQKLQSAARKTGQLFLRALAAQITVWLAVVLAGLGAIVYWFFRWFLTPKPPVRVMPAPLLRPWRPLEALEAWVFLLLAVVMVRALAQLLLAQKGLPTTVRAVGDVLAYLAASALAIGVMARTLRGQQPPPAVLLGLRPFRPVALALGTLAYGVFLAALGLTGSAFSILFGSGVAVGVLAQWLGTAPVHDPVAAAIYAGLAVVVAPVLEETIFRGFVYPGLRRRLSPAAAILTTALMFAITHVGLPVPALVGLFVLATALAYAFERTRNLYVPIGMHITHNALVFALMLLMAL